MIIILTVFILAIFTLLITILLINKKSKTNPNQSEDNLNKMGMKKLGITYQSTYYKKEDCEWMDDILINAIKSGIKTDKHISNAYRLTVFNNNTSFNYWDNNKYYAWLSQGYLEFVDNKTNELIKIDYNNKQPSPYVMYRFKTLLDEFHGNIESKYPSDVTVKKIKLDENS